MSSRSGSLLASQVFAPRGKVLGYGMSRPRCLPTPFLSMDLAPCANLLAGCICTALGAVPWWGPCHPSHWCCCWECWWERDAPYKRCWWYPWEMGRTSSDVSRRSQELVLFWTMFKAHVGTPALPSPRAPFACQPLKQGRKAGKITGFAHRLCRVCAEPSRSRA